MERKLHIIDTITTAITTIGLFLLPVFFLPLTQDFYDTNKWLLLIIMAILLFVAWGVRAAITNELSISLHPATWGFGALTIASGISTIASSPNKIESLLHPLGPIFFLTLTIISLLTGHIWNSRHKTLLRRSLYASGIVLGAIAIVQYFALLAKILPQATFLADPLWTPTGNTPATIVFLVLLLPMLIDDIRRAVMENTLPNIIAPAITTAVIVTGITLLTVKYIPTYAKTTMPLAAGWAITLDVFKEPVSMLTGIGPENFLAAFTMGRPAQLNTGELWSTRFLTNASFIFHVMATLGTIGTVAIAILIRMLIPKHILAHTISRRLPKGIEISALLAIVMLFVAPPSFSLITLTLGILFLLHENTTEKTWKLPTNIESLGKEVLVVTLIISGAVSYGVGRSYAAELFFYQSILAARNNDGTTTYNQQIKTLEANPYMSRFHLAYSQTNWAIANAIASNAPAGPDGARKLTDEDRQTVTTLIQQAIREAKLAVTYAPTNVVAWENLAALYQNLAGIVEGADQWTIATYQRSIQLDPTNPILRLRYGTQLIRANSDGALQQFLIATNLKPDYANAHYHLAVIYNERKEYLKTAVELRQALALVPMTAPDYTRVSGELDVIKTRLTAQELAAFEGKAPEANNQTEDVLTNPKEEKVTTIKPKIELPPEASPPAVPAFREEATPSAQ